MKKFIAIISLSLIGLSATPSAYAQFGQNDQTVAAKLEVKSTTSTDGANQEVAEALVKNAPVFPGTTPKPLATPGKFSDVGNGMVLEVVNFGFGSGLKVIDVNKLGLAHRNGLEKGDIVTMVHGKSTQSSNELENAFKSIPKSAFSVEMEVINIRTGNSQKLPYVMSTDAGEYQTNFGRLELTEMPTADPAETAVTGSLFFYSGIKSTITGSLKAGFFRGTSNAPGNPQATLQMSKNGQMFEGTVTQNGKTFPLFVIRRN